jgi:hypothetical protein
MNYLSLEMYVGHVTYVEVEPWIHKAHFMQQTYLAEQTYGMKYKNRADIRNEVKAEQKYGMK